MSILFKYSSINRGKKRPINQNVQVESMSDFKKKVSSESAQGTHINENAQTHE